MRLTKTLAVVTTVAALTALTGCGSDGDALSGLPKADDMATLEKLINAHSTCRELQAGTARLGDAGTKMVKDPAFAVKEAATCKAADGDKVRLFLVSDMKKFQEANKKAQDADASFDSAYMIGQNFAVVPGSNDAKELKPAGFAMMTCNPANKAKIPSGYKVDEPLVKGCIVTDYFPG
ncbi:hypothetical protein GCM10010302_73470 [Streptomyces polychromogenes]|uniref:Lipoprotein n=1 Tax=Streptomyces polychromogenes TaxID=67342 RepID=A0ABN0W2P4_9ACTN